MTPAAASLPSKKARLNPPEMAEGPMFGQAQAQAQTQAQEPMSGITKEEAERVLDPSQLQMVLYQRKHGPEPPASVNSAVRFPRICDGDVPAAKYDPSQLQMVPFRRGDMVPFSRDYNSYANGGRPSRAPQAPLNPHPSIEILGEVDGDDGAADNKGSDNDGDVEMM
ncbi:Hypothetical Protein FCC1311_094282 [Hondaea fermentalgiana]|uniref:Uncharacterized protein n=1 Tax=Hondaea fermentalgiana TaxID=2315210 RepID=A0A2R5GYX0_9STRA|nr:Hypothetical Protein FCC1311_094282 [Hondaea fermentalgiana]|eukprot:GBG33204.1 Hypothetical Protein FCC1311_094282 [Hondaea fermentalgiana]